MENLIKGKSETAANAAITGESDLFEAVRGISHSGDSHGAVVGINDNQTPTAGPGVFGKSRGTGVWGQSETWHGVAGLSESTTGGVGVYGKGKGAGVLGEGGSWHGVAGLSESTTGGAGVYGKGKNLAGLFEGNVSITENLIVKGVSFQALIQLVQQLQSEVKVLQQKTNSTPPQSTTSAPQISVKIDSGKQIIKGTGFLPNKLVTVRVAFDDFTELSHQQNADGSGNLDFTLSLKCVSGIRMHFSATDSRKNNSDITGVLWSNIFTTTCP